MNRDEARELLSDAIEGGLDEETRAQLDALLETDDELREEMDALRMVMRGAGALAAADDGAESPDLLAGVQSRLRQRSKGRYYRDRFSRGSGPKGLSPVLMLLVAVLLMAVAWLLLQQVVVIDTP